VDLVMSSPTSAHQARKYLWGIFLHGDLIGYLDVVRNWPVGHVHIGALMVAERLQGQGHGSQALQLLAQRTKGWSGIRRWRLAVLETHTAARAFWAHQGFVATGQRQQRADYSAALLVMEKVIGH
jgi:RimJ/RimL family protein N-acetyltransferase